MQGEAKDTAAIYYAGSAFTSLLLFLPRAEWNCLSLLSQIRGRMLWFVLKQNCNVCSEMKLVDFSPPVIRNNVYSEKKQVDFFKLLELLCV